MDEILNVALDVCVQKWGGERPDAYARAAEQREAEGDSIYGKRYMGRDNLSDAAEELYDTANYFRFLLRQKQAVLDSDAWDELRMKVIGAIATAAQNYREGADIKRFVLENEE